MGVLFTYFGHGPFLECPGYECVVHVMIRCDWLLAYFMMFLPLSCIWFCWNRTQVGRLFWMNWFWWFVLVNTLTFVNINITGRKNRESQKFHKKKFCVSIIILGVYMQQFHTCHLPVWAFWNITKMVASGGFILTASRPPTWKGFRPSYCFGENKKCLSVCLLSKVMPIEMKKWSPLSQIYFLRHVLSFDYSRMKIVIIVPFL